MQSKLNIRFVKSIPNASYRVQQHIYGIEALLQSQADALNLSYNAKGIQPYLYGNQLCVKTDDMMVYCFYE